MIVCDFIDKNVEDFIEKDKSKRIILTFFKEPFDDFKGNEVLFIDDILDDNDYKRIDIFVNKAMKDAKEIFSKYLEVDGYKLFDYLQVQAKRNLSKMYKFKYCVDKLAKGKDKINVYYFSSELELLEWLKQDYIINIINKNTSKKKSNIKLKVRRWAKNLGYIPQHIYLSDDTITNNIAFSIPDEKIDREMVEQAAKIANLHDFIILELPNGYQAIVRE